MHVAHPPSSGSLRPLLLVAALCASRTASAQEARFQDPDGPLPAPAAVFAKHAAAYGDLKGHTALLVSGTITGAGVASGSRFERYTDSSSRYLHRTLYGNTEVAVEGWTGSAAFRITRGARVSLTRGQVAVVRERGLAFGGNHPRAVQATATATEWSDFFKCLCVKLWIKLAPGDARSELYDPQSGELKGIVRNGMDADGKREDRLVVFLSYREFEGVRVPVDILEAVGKSEWRLTVDEVRWDPPVPARLVQRGRR